VNGNLKLKSSSHWSPMGEVSACKIQRRTNSMKKSLMGGVLSLLFLAGGSLAAAQQQAQSDSMKHDTMTKDDAMSKDKMSREMAKPKVVKGWVTDSECAAHGDKMCANKQHLAQGAKLVIVTEGDNKIWTVANPEKRPRTPKREL
jgi:hypothetical protein